MIVWVSNFYCNKNVLHIHVKYGENLGSNNNPRTLRANNSQATLNQNA